MGLIEALHAEVADTEAAFAQLQQESSGHADLLASHSDQVIHHASQLMTVSTCYSTLLGMCNLAVAKLCLPASLLIVPRSAYLRPLTRVCTARTDSRSITCVCTVHALGRTMISEVVFAVLMCMSESNLSLCFGLSR